VFSFQLATKDQVGMDRYWNTIVGKSVQESQCGWCKDGGELIDIYLPVTVDTALIALTAAYRNEKGNLAFPLDQAIPFELIGSVAMALSKQYGQSPS
jgi:hypothetical protein